MNRIFVAVGAVAALLTASLCATSAFAQDDATFPQEQLDQLLAPIALYPDALLSQVLMASTYPADVAEAAKWSKANPDAKGDDAVSAVAEKPWDPSVQSLVAFPQALEMMGDKPDWVQQLGDAFLAQPEDVMDTVQGLRKRANDEGNLETTEQQKVIIEEPAPEQTVIVIEPADPQVVYVPAYNPTVVYGPWWWPRYPAPFYWPPPPIYGFGGAFMSGIGFGLGLAVTDSLWGGCDWGRGDVDINVNKYNNINIDRNKIDIDNRKKNVKWKHNPENRKGVPYRDKRSREKFGKKNTGAKGREQFRGRDGQRDASRDKAQQALKGRGLDPARSREKLRDDPKTRQRAQAASQKSNRDRQRPSTKSGKDRSQARAAAQRAERSRTQKQAPKKKRDSALRGASNPARARKSIDRGSSSRRSAASRRSGGGGGMRRGGGGGGGSRGGGLGRRR